MKVVIFLVSMLYTSVFAFAQPDFGADGLKGLSETQLRELKSGQIVITVGNLPTSGQTSDKATAFIEAAMVMAKPPSEAWKYLYRTEDQYLYMRETESSTVLSRSLDQILIEYRVRVLLVETSFRLFHHYDARFWPQPGLS